MRIFIMRALIATVAVGVLACGGDEVEATGGTGGAGPVGRDGEAEIDAEGGMVSVVDEHGNKIEAFFSEGALAEPTLVSLSLRSGGTSFEIETPHVPQFEIRPHDLTTYAPVSVFVSYATPVADIERSLIVRQNDDQLIVPLADHGYFHDATGGSQSVRAFLRNGGVFGEGQMSLEQVESHLDALLASRDVSLEQSLKDDTCYTNITKALWDDWKEAGDGVEELGRVAALMGSGFYPDEEALAQSVCEGIVAGAARIVLDRCRPEDVCDRDFRYVVAQALAEAQRCGSFGGEIHDELYGIFEEIQDTCIKDGALAMVLSGFERLDYNVPPDTPYRSELSSGSHGVVPLEITILNDAGFAEVDDADIEFGAVPLLPLTGSGTILYWPAAPELAKLCDLGAKGFLKVDVSGRRDTRGNYDLAVVTNHHYDLIEQCPGEPSFVYSDRSKARVFEVYLNSENNYSARATANDDPQWTIETTLKLPNP